MTRGQAAVKRRSAWDMFVTVWGIAVIPNALDAFGLEMNGGWHLVRLALGALWLVALLSLIVAFIRERRAPPEPASG